LSISSPWKIALCVIIKPMSRNFATPAAKNLAMTLDKLDHPTTC